MKTCEITQRRLILELPTIGEIMKKNLIALAIFAAASTTAMAQSNVEVYGVVDMGLQSVDNGVDSKFGIDSGLANGSKLGFKGVEDLGNGLKAGFQLETGINADTGGSNNWDNGTFVYLEGKDWGKVSLGKQFTPLRNSLNVIDPFVTSYAGDARYMFSSNGQFSGFPTRLGNSVSFTSNVYSGFSASAIYGAGEQWGSESQGRTIGLSAYYKQGPIDATVAYNKTNGVGLGEAKKTVMLGGSYDFGVAKAHLGYNDYKEGDYKKRNYLVGVSAPVGQAGRVMASYTINDVRSVDNADSQQFAIGYTHHLSKRTNLYTMYSRTTNDDNASLRVAQAGKTGSTFQAGIRHAF